MRFSVPFSARFALLATLPILPALWPAPLWGATQESQIDSLSTLVSDLRFAGRYGEALDAARTLAARAQSDSGIPAWMRADAAADLRGLERIQDLSERSRQELAAAHRLFERVGSEFERARYAEAEAATRRQLAAFEKILGEYDRDTGLAFNNLGACLDAEGDLKGRRRPIRRRFESTESRFLRSIRRCSRR